MFFKLKKNLFFLGLVLACLFKIANGEASPEPSAKPTAASPVILVDDFDQAYSPANHLGGSFGMVAEGGDAHFEFVKPPVPYLVNSSSLKITYKLKSHPGYAFLWMKLGKRGPVHEVTDPLDLSAAVFLSFKYQSKEPVNFKLELHEDADGDGRFDMAKDRSSFVYLDTVKKYDLENGWIKVLMPLKRFAGIKDWSKILEMVFVFEKDKSGSSGEIFLDDLLFIPKELKNDDVMGTKFFEKMQFFLNGARAASDQPLAGENHLRFVYEPNDRFENLESFVIQIKTEKDGDWYPAVTAFNPGNREMNLKWEAFSFNPPPDISMRIIANDFFGHSQVLAGPLENLRVPVMTDEGFLNLVSHKACLFFTENQDPKSGLFFDTTGGGDLSTAVTGFGLSALVIGVERGWIDRKEARKRILKCLDSFLHKIESKEGFYYHFLDPRTLKRAGKSEISTVDTALLLAGVVTSGEYFGGSVKSKARKLYKKANWDFYLQHDENDEHYLQFHHGWTPEEGLADNYWDYYTDETLLLDLMAIGAPSHAVSPDIFYRFQRREGKYKDMAPFIYTWHGSLFSYQYANAWFDFRNVVDDKGINWFENSKKATLSNRQFAVDLSAEFKTYGKDSWGITSMRIPDRYVMHYGPLPNGQNKAEHDGSIAPSGPGGSIPFTPYLSLRVLKNLYIQHPELWGIYGFKDSLNLDRAYVSPVYYGLGEGILLLGIENFRTGLVWNYFSKNESVKKALELSKFRPDASKLQKPPSLFPEWKTALDGASMGSKRSVFTQLLEKEMPFEDAELLYKEAEKTYPESLEGPILVLKGRLRAKMIQTLEGSDLESGRLYLKKADTFKSEAVSFFEKALKSGLPDVERLDIYKYSIGLLKETQDPVLLNRVYQQLGNELKEGIKRQTYNLAWALQWAEQLDENAALRLRSEFFNDLSARDRKVMFETLKQKSREALARGDYAAAADLSEEQIRFMEAPTYRRVLISYLDRTAKTFFEAQKFAEAERFYLKIIDHYGNEKDREKYVPEFAAMLDKKGDKERAVKEYEAYVEEFPQGIKSGEAVMRLANIYSGLGNRDKAIELFKGIAAKDKSSPEAENALYLLGMVYFHAQKFPEALKSWEDLLRQFPNTPRQSVVREYMERADQKEATPS